MGHQERGAVRGCCVGVRSDQICRIFDASCGGASDSACHGRKETCLEWCVVVLSCVRVNRKTQENGTKRVNKRGGNMVIIVRENTKCQETFGNYQNKDSFFFLARYGQRWTKKKKTSENGLFSPTHCFLHFPWDLPTISDMGSHSKRLKNAVLGPRS